MGLWNNKRVWKINLSFEFFELRTFLPGLISQSSFCDLTIILYELFLNDQRVLVKLSRFGFITKSFSPLQFRFRKRSRAMHRHKKFKNVSSSSHVIESMFYCSVTSPVSVKFCSLRNLNKTLLGHVILRKLVNFIDFRILRVCGQNT